MPAAPASAEPIHVQMRLVPGDALHYTTEGHMLLSANTTSDELPQEMKIDYRIGVLMTVQETFPDGSARVREEIDSAEIAGVDAADSQEVVGMAFTFTAHSDGSWTDFRSEGDDSTSLFGQLLPGGGASSFPTEGLDVGQSSERNLPFNLLGPDKPIDLPIRTTLEGLAVEDGRPAARLKQTFNVPETETPFGPFGASGSAKLHIAGDASSAIDLGTGWPLKMGGVVGYGFALQGEGQQTAGIDVQLQYSLVLDQQLLAEQ